MAAIDSLARAVARLEEGEPAASITPLVEAAARRYLDESTTDRLKAEALVTPTLEPTLVAVAHDLAERAVEEESPDLVRASLAALCLARQRPDDYRTTDQFVVLPLRSADRLGMDVRYLTASVARQFSEPARGWLLGWSNASSAERDIRTMGWEEVLSRRGRVRYQPDSAGREAAARLRELYPD